MLIRPKILVQSLFIRKIDYCNALLIGTPKYLLVRLQRIQNMGAHVIVGLNKFDHVFASMFELHWLKIEYRISYKVCTIVFKARNGFAPSYIIDLIPQCFVRKGTLETNDLLPHTYSRTAIMRNQSFRVMSEHIWNSLPRPRVTQVNLELAPTLIISRNENKNIL